MSMSSLQCSGKFRTVDERDKYLFRGYEAGTDAVVTSWPWGWGDGVAI